MRKHELGCQLNAFPPNAKVLVCPEGQPAILAEIVEVVNDHGRAVIHIARLMPDWMDESEAELLRERGQAVVR